MKLALIRRQFAATGGAELYVQRLLKALAAGGHDVHLFAERWSGTPEGVTLHAVLVKGGRADRPWSFAREVKNMLNPVDFDCVFSLERTLRQDVYRAGDGVHRAWLQRRRQFAPWWRRPFVGWGAFHRNMATLEAETFSPANTGRIIVNSDMVRHEIVDHFRFPADRTHLVRNGVDVERFQGGRRAETRARFGFREQDLVLLFVGSGWERKGLRFALQALDRFSIRQGLEILEKEWDGQGDPPGRSRLSIRLLVVGKGSKPRWTPSDVVFAGSMPDVENAYAAADVFLFLPIYEPCANVVSEALAAGLPVITSFQNGASELVQDGITGSVIADPSNTDTVVDALVFWASQRFNLRPSDTSGLRIDGNVTETLRILELAANERKGLSS